MILKSNVYIVLRDQCQYLMDYISDLLAKLKKNQEYLAIIEKNREEEIRELRRKIEKNRFGNQTSISPTNPQILNIPFTFKSDALALIKSLKTSY